MMRRSECITAVIVLVIVLASTGRDAASATTSASAASVTFEAIVRRLQRRMRNIGLSRREPAAQKLFQLPGLRKIMISARCGPRVMAAPWMRGSDAQTIALSD